MVIEKLNKKHIKSRRDDIIEKSNLFIIALLSFCWESGLQNND